MPRFARCQQGPRYRHHGARDRHHIGPARHTTDATPQFSFDSSEAGSSFECRIDFGAWAGCTASYTSASLADGRHLFQVRATDGVGQVDTTPAVEPFTVLTASGSIVAWGDTASPPAGTDFLAVDGGYSHALGLRTDGASPPGATMETGRQPRLRGTSSRSRPGSSTHRPESDGSNRRLGGEQLRAGKPPAGNDYVAVGRRHVPHLALKSDGSIVGWGRNDDGQATPPTGNDYVAVAAGYHHSVALKSDGSVAAWGLNNVGQATPPGGSNFVAVAAGSWHALALRADGSLVGWGDNPDGRATPPAGTNHDAIAAGDWHSLALRDDGTLVRLGSECLRSGHPPFGNRYVAVTAGWWFGLGSPRTRPRPAPRPSPAPRTPPRSPPQTTRSTSLHGRCRPGLGRRRLLLPLGHLAIDHPRPDQGRRGVGDRDHQSALADATRTTFTCARVTTPQLDPDRPPGPVRDRHRRAFGPDDRRHRPRLSRQRQQPRGQGFGSRGRIDGESYTATPAAAGRCSAASGGRLQRIDRITAAVAGDATTNLRATCHRRRRKHLCLLVTVRYVEDSSAPDITITSAPPGRPTTPARTSASTPRQAQASSAPSTPAPPPSAPVRSASSHTPSSPLSDGNYTFRVRATDAAGNQAPATRSFIASTPRPRRPDDHRHRPRLSGQRRQPRGQGVREQRPARP